MSIFNVTSQIEDIHNKIELIDANKLETIQHWIFRMSEVEPYKVDYIVEWTDQALHKLDMNDIDNIVKVVDWSITLTDAISINENDIQYSINWAYEVISNNPASEINYLIDWGVETTQVITPNDVEKLVNVIDWANDLTSVIPAEKIEHLIESNEYQMLLDVGLIGFVALPWVIMLCLVVNTVKKLMK